MFANEFAHVIEKIKESGGISRFLDHTMLKPEAKEEDIRKLCAEAAEYNCYSVCVNSSYVPLAKEALTGTAVHICAVVGFPLGATSSDVKVYETVMATEAGADEIDMVINIGRLRDNKDHEVRDEIAAISAAARKRGAILKVILETGLLSNEEIFRACFLAKEAGASFVKTSTGFLAGGATEAHVKLMREAVGDTMGVKASGGIGDYETAVRMIAAGASRIGASKSVEIIKQRA